MAKVKIYKKDGTPTQYFWSSREGNERPDKTVYKQTAEGVKRMKGVTFNAETKRLQKQ